MVSSWIRSMFSSKNKNKKPVLMLRPRLFKDLELVLLEDRITPAYSLTLQGTDLVLQVLPNNLTPPDPLRDVASNISLVGSRLTVTTNWTLSSAPTIPATTGWGNATFGPNLSPNVVVNPAGTVFSLDLNDANLQGNNLTRIVFQNSIPAADFNTTAVAFNLGNMDFSNSTILNLNNLGISTSGGNAVVPNNSILTDINIVGSIKTRGNGSVILDTGTGSAPNGRGASQMTIVDGSITTNTTAGVVTLTNGIPDWSNAQINTSGAAVSVSGVLDILAASRITTNNLSAGANITFTGIIGSGTSAASLTLNAGTAGNVTIPQIRLLSSNGALIIPSANLVTVSSTSYTEGGFTVNCNIFDGTNLDLDTTFLGNSRSGDVSVTATGNITFNFISTSGGAGQSAGDISLSGGDIFLLNFITANGGTAIAGSPGQNAGAITLTATDITPLITVNADIIAAGTTGTTTGLGGQVTFNSPVSFTRLSALNTSNTIRTFGTNTGNSGNITFGSTATISGAGNQGLVLDAAGGGTNPALIGDISLGANILNGAIASLSILGGLIGVKDFGTASQSGILGTVSMTSYLNDGTSPTNNINFNGNTYNASSTQVYTGVSGKAFSMLGSALTATTFSNVGANITFNNSVIELAQSDLIINTNGGNIRALNITSSTSGAASQNKDVTLNAGNGTVFVGQIGGFSGNYGNLNGVNTVLITGLSGVTLNSNILTSNFTNNSVTLNGPVVINANTSINTSQNTLDTTGTIFLSSTLNALGGVTLTLDASNSTQSANVTIAGLIGAGLSGSLGGLTIEGNQVSINGIGSATQFGVIGSTLVTAANAGSIVGAISFTGTTYRTNGIQTYDASGTNALTLNGGINGSLTSFITLDDAVTFNGSFNINLRNLAVDTTNAVSALVAVGNDINFNGTVSGSASLTLTAGNFGNVNLAQNVGSGQALTGVVINSSLAINSQAINVGGTGSITLTSDTFNLLGTVSSTSGTITLQPNTLTLPLAINNSIVGGGIAITTPVINNFSTLGMVIYGNTLGAGNINLAGSSPTFFPYNVTFRTGSSAKIYVNGSVSTSGKTITYAGEVIESTSAVLPTTTSPTVVNGVVQNDIIVTSPGNGFQTPPTVILTGGGGTGATAVAIIGTQATANAAVGVAANATATLGTVGTAVGTLGTLATASAALGTQATATATLGTTAQATYVFGTQAFATATVGGTTAQATATAGTQAAAEVIIGAQATGSVTFGTLASGQVTLGTLAQATAITGELATANANVGDQAVAFATIGTRATAYAVLGNGTEGTAGTVYTIPVSDGGNGYFTGLTSVNINGSGGSGFNTGVRYSVNQAGTTSTAAITVLQLASVPTNSGSINGVTATPGVTNGTANISGLNPATGRAYLGGYRITSAGTAYPASSSFPVTLGGPATATFTPTGATAYTNATGQIMNLVLDNNGGGDGYINGTTYSIVSSTTAGSGATIRGFTASGADMTYTTDATTGVITSSSFINNLSGLYYVDRMVYRVNIPGGFTASVVVQADSILTLTQGQGAQFAVEPSFRGLGYTNLGGVTINGTASGIAYTGPQVYICLLYTSPSPRD